ncbi:MAG: 16S rRNA (guanine(966)-N(2))-methyltransferase RsmD [Microbacteriaceae bacterium]
MTRIIAGFAGSREIAVPKSGTRPTSDRVREAIFSALDARDAITDARVLDLFAGSGALGLESLSRGAASVVLVEKNAKAAEIARKNAELIRSVGKLAPACLQVVVNTVAHFLDGRAESSADTGSFDLVFIDPPYDVADTELDDVLAALAPHLAPGAEVVVERSTRSAAPQPPAGLTLDKSKAYGETTIHWLSRD